MKIDDMTPAQIRRAADEIRDYGKTKKRWNFEDGTNVGAAVCALANFLDAEAQRREIAAKAPTDNDETAARNTSRKYRDMMV